MSLVPLVVSVSPARAGGRERRRSYACACSRPASASVDAEPSLDDTLGHSFCYSSSTAAHYSFRHGIFGAALSANSSVPVPLYQSFVVAVGAMPPNYSSAFHTSSSFSFALLQLSNLSSEPLFLFGPIDCGAQLSSPLDPFSDPLPTKPTKPAPSSSGGLSRRLWKPSFGSLRRSVSGKNRPLVVPLRRDEGV